MNYNWISLYNFLLNLQTENRKISKTNQPDFWYAFFSRIKEENSGIINNENKMKIQKNLKFL